MTFLIKYLQNRTSHYFLLSRNLFLHCAHSKNTSSFNLPPTLFSNPIVLFSISCTPFGTVICYLELHWISAICNYLSEDVTKKLLYVFVLSRLDYYNLLLVGCPKYRISKLQKLQNNAATHFQNNQTCPHHSYASFSSLATYWAEDQVVSALL